MTSLTQPSAEKLPSINEATRIAGLDRGVILAAMNAGSLPYRSVDHRNSIALRDALAFRNSFLQFLRRPGENRPASLRNEGHRYGC